MFSVADRLSDTSHERCDDEFSCSSAEAYLDQISERNYEAAYMENANLADPEEFLEYTLKGITVPVRMRKDSEAIQISGENQIKMQIESPFPPVVVETVVTDPIIVTSLGSDTTISASIEAIAILKQHRKHKKRSPKSREPILEGYQDSGTTTPHMRAPPPTPPEHATFPNTLSTPHLPVFHRYTDDMLLQQYQVERTKNPTAFDLQTAKIKQYLLNAKIERGGVGFLEESEYSVDLASREDARKMQRMAVQRNRGMTETYLNSYEGTTSDSTRHPSGYSEILADQTADFASTNEHHNILPSARDSAKTSKSDPCSNAKIKSKKSSSSLPKDFDFAEHVAKYTTSGSMRHQHSRKVIEDENGTQTTLKTWIEITQEINVPSADQLGWEDVKTAERNARVAELGNTQAPAKQEQNGSDTDRDKEAGEQSAAEADAEELLDAIARIKGTGWLSRGVSLSQYLMQVKKDVKPTSKDTATDKAESGHESE